MFSFLNFINVLGLSWVHLQAFVNTIMGRSCFINSVESLEEVSDQKLPEKDLVP